MKRNSSLLFSLTALLLAACSTFPPRTDPLDGTSWELVAVAGQQVVPGTKVTIEFDDGRAGGTAGCNGYGGAYELAGKQQIRFQEIVSTMMLCTSLEGVMEQEAGFLGALEQVERFELAEGQLQLLRSGGKALTFVPAP